jgi:hypothetical protein
VLPILANILFSFCKIRLNRGGVLFNTLSSSNFLYLCSILSLFYLLAVDFSLSRKKNAHTKQKKSHTVYENLFSAVLMDEDNCSKDKSFVKSVSGLEFEGI